MATVGVKGLNTAKVMMHLVMGLFKFCWYHVYGEINM